MCCPMYFSASTSVSCPKKGPSQLAPNKRRPKPCRNRPGPAPRRCRPSHWPSRPPSIRKTWREQHHGGGRATSAHATRRRRRRRREWLGGRREWRTARRSGRDGRRQREVGRDKIHDPRRWYSPPPPCLDFCSFLTSVLVSTRLDLPGFPPHYELRSGGGGSPTRLHPDRPRVWP
jgi:hypothetical protein